MIVKCVVKVLVGMLACLTSPSLALLDNSLSPLGMGGVGLDGDSPSEDWVTLTAPPPRAVRAAPGSRVELECEAAGSNPSIHWLPAQDLPNHIPDSEPQPEQGLRKVRSRLILPASPSIITCMAVSGTRVTSSSTAILPDLSLDPSLDSSSSTPAPARVLLWHPVVLAPQRQSVMLPCTGAHHTHVRWMDPQGRSMPAMADGSLRIPNLTWQHMGAYTCVVSNQYSKDVVQTFLYPLAVEN